MTDDRSDRPVTPSDQQKRGYDIAREALEEARARARAEGKQVGQGRRAPVGSGKRLRRRGWTGSGADPWDPQPLGRLVGQVARKRGWDDKVATGRLFAEWDRIVGEDVAAHATPDRLEDKILYVRASSTAWATQLRLMAADILRKIAAAMGPGHVRRLKIEGPAGPSWRKGPLHVSGRGPRDTYG
ncbi:MAG TPA: DUF721 domain-containing protein [Candidatus Dietzia intestinipullorum]|nr:DUF721 domain-containing protein [Candidatus Dietzia intestinipullorum]